MILHPYMKCEKIKTIESIRKVSIGNVEQVKNGATHTAQNTCRTEFILLFKKVFLVYSFE